MRFLRAVKIVGSETAQQARAASARDQAADQPSKNYPRLAAAGRDPKYKPYITESGPRRRGHQRLTSYCRYRTTNSSFFLSSLQQSHGVTTPLAFLLCVTTCFWSLSYHRPATDLSPYYISTSWIQTSSRTRLEHRYTR
jgi:hypothetical protein